MVAPNEDGRATGTGGYDRDAPLAALFEAQARESPEAVAVRCGGASVTYGALNACANRLARHLLRLGATPEDCVAVCLERGIPFVTALLAILKAGAAYLPIEPATPAARRRFLLEDASARLLLGPGAITDSLPEQTQLVSSPWEDQVADLDDSDPPALATGASLAYIMYTSGTSGQPKGVCVLQRGVARLVRGTDFCQITPEDRVAHVSNVAFDAATFEIWGALLNGALLTILPNETLLDAVRFAEALAAERVSAMFLTAPLFHQYAAEQPAMFSGLDTLIVGGDAVDPGASRAVLAAGPPRRLLNGYGPTETTTFATWYRINELPEEAISVPIGKAIAHSKAYLLDESLVRTVPGETGELYLGGDGVARGYLNRPELTRERFLPDPFSQTPGAQLYKTGDLCRELPDGNLEFLGRADRQVKIRGFRVELEEIEAVLARHPGVSAAAVLARPDGAGGKRVDAYWAPQPGQAAPNVAELRAYLRGEVPDYMAPATLTLLDALPLTPNGKIDRAALPMPELTEQANNALSPLGTQLAELWQEILGTAVTDSSASFFELGGHSLLAMQLLARIRKRYGAAMPYRVFHGAPTLGAMAAWLEAAPAGQEQDTLSPASPTKDAPPSLGQQRLLFLERFAPGNTAYTIALRFYIDASIDAQALDAALTEVVERHAVLRSVFVEEQERMVQRILPPAPWTSAQSDLSELPESMQERAIADIAAEEARRPFDLATGPLLRTLLLRLGPARHVLCLTVHHAAFDGWSIEVFRRELEACYSAALEGATPALPPLPLSYTDYATWQCGRATPAALESQLTFWRGCLANLPAPLELPLDCPRPPALTFAGACEWATLGAQSTSALRRVARQRQTTLFSVLAAAWLTLVYRYTGQDDLVLGTALAGRTRAEFEPLIGFFVNTLPIRVAIEPGDTFSLLVDRVQGVMLELQDHQDVPLDALVDAFLPGRDPARHPLFQVMFVLQNTPASNPGAALPMRMARTHNGGAKFELTLDATELEDAVALELEYNTALFEADTVRRMLDAFIVLAAAAAQEPETPLDALPLRDAAETGEHFQSTPDLSTPTETLWTRFAQQAALTPDAVALTDGDRSWSYADLRRNAENLAHSLQAGGTSRNARVAILMEPSAELVAGILAILACGAAYVPLDPAYPPERIRFILKDAECAALLTTPELRPALPDYGILVVTPAGEDAPSEAPLPSPGEASGIAYIIYTSGSTGQPKGVLVSHANVLGLFEATRQVFEFGARDVWSLFHAVTFDFSVWELFGALLHGGRLVIVPCLAARDPGEFHALLAHQGVTVLNQTPAAFGALLQWEAGYPPEEVRLITLRYVIFGGEALDLPSLAPWFARHGAASPRLVNMFGITETTVHVTCHTISAEECVPGAPSVIGRGLPGTRLCVLDGQGRPVPRGARGELHVAGWGVTQGYLNRPEITGARFLGGVDSQERHYRSGDIVRERADGTLVHCGRGDRQVKLRGFRIELGEIEARLRAHPAVGAAAVVLRRGPIGGELDAFVCPRANVESPAPQALGAWVRAALPAHLSPAHITVLDTLPRTRHGKVDYRALEQLPLGPAPAAGEYTGPRTPEEAALCALWERLLGVGRVGIHDNFFQLGGHSLLAIRAVAAMEEELGSSLSLRDLFDKPTPAQLAGAGRLRTQEGLPHLHLLRPGDGDCPLFLVEGGGSAASIYGDLAPHLCPGQAVYGMDALDISHEEYSGMTLADVADRLLASLEAAAPSGRCALAGWSFGGAVAEAMALELLRRGREVRLLILFDVSAAPRASGWQGLGDTAYLAATHARIYAGMLPEMPKYAAGAFRVGREGLRNGGPRGALRQLRRYTAFTRHRAIYAYSLKVSGLSHRESLGQHLELFRATFVGRILERLVANQRLFADLIFPPFPGRMLLIRPERDFGGMARTDPTLGWKQRALGGLEVRITPGNHFTMLKPEFSPRVAEVINRALESP